MMMTAQELAKYIISQIKNQMKDIQPEEFDVTPLKLQKLLYYCQGYSLALTGKRAFMDKIEAWEYGPVIESVYREYKKYTGRVIPFMDVDTVKVPDEPLESIVRLVLSEKGKYSGTVLAKATHKESPWRDVYRGRCTNAEISPRAMELYFSEEFEKREEDYEEDDEFWETAGEPVSDIELEAALEKL